MKKNLLLLLLISFASLGQKNVDEIEKVRNPKEGKLYFETKSKGLFLYDGLKFQTILSQTVTPPDTIKPPDTIPTEPPFIINTSPIKVDVVLVKQVDWTATLTQNNKRYKIFRVIFEDNNYRSYLEIEGTGYQGLGKNIYSNPGVKIQNGFNATELINNSANRDTDSGNGGLIENFKHPKINSNYVSSASPNPIPSGKFPVPVSISYWNQVPNDWVNCTQDNWRYPSCNFNGYDINLESNGARGAMALYSSIGTKSESKPPFYSDYISTIDITSKVNGGGVVGKTNYTAKFDQDAFNKTMQYVENAGINIVNFYFYDTDADVAEHITYNQSTTSNISYHYTLGSLGYNAKTTMDRIISHMQQSRYYKISGRPVLENEEPSGMLFHVDRYIERAGATFINDGNEQYWKQNEGYNGTILFEPANGFVKASGNTSKQRCIEYINEQLKKVLGTSLYTINSGGYFYYSDGLPSDAVGTYLLTSSEDQTTHNYASLIKESVQRASEVKGNIVPNITLGFGNIHYNGQVAGYLYPATKSEILEHISRIKDFVNKNKERVPIVKFYSLGELGECGAGAALPRKNIDGSIDTSILDWIKEAISN